MPLVSYLYGLFNYTYDHTQGPTPAEFRLYWGYATGVYTGYVSLGPTPYASTFKVVDTVPGTNDYFARICASDGNLLEWGYSPEVNFTAAPTSLVTVGAPTVVVVRNT